MGTPKSHGFSSISGITKWPMAIAVYIPMGGLTRAIRIALKAGPRESQPKWKPYTRCVIGFVVSTPWKSDSNCRLSQDGNVQPILSNRFE